MLQTIWQKIKQNHLLLMILCCAVPIILVIGFFALFKAKSSYWVWLIILLCPILHIWMMRGRKHKKKLYKCPECKFLYKEKKWAEKCQAWCRKYHTCNIEITSHAIKDKERRCSADCQQAGGSPTD